MNNIKNIFRNGILMAAGLAALCACSDTWDDHYNPNGALSYDGTTMQAIKEKASDFAEVLVAAGMEKELNSESAYTLWVPANGSFDKSAILDQIENGNKKEVVKRFISSHMARYNVSLGTEAQTVKLMNSKIVEMGTFNAPTFGKTTISESNVACRNGVIHLIDGENEYVPNLYEAIADRDASSTASMSFYKFLEECDSFILDEERSLSYGVDEDGLPIYVDSITERWNRAIVGAEIFEEDSNFIVIAPSAEAFQKRYEIAKSLLKFNPSEDQKKAGRVDSLTRTLAGRFAIKDLIYTMNDGKNKHLQDSIVSTDYTGYNDWELSRYYRPFAANGILSPANRADSLKCSNGIIYYMNDYPMSVTEQFFNLKRITPTNAYVNRKTSPNGSAQPYATEGSKQTFYTYRQVYYPYKIHTVLEDTVISKTTYQKVNPDSIDTIPGVVPSTMQITWLDCEPTSNTSAAKYAFELPNTLSGKYNIKIVTVPFWAKNGFVAGVPNNTLYKFTAELFQKQNGEEAIVGKIGEYGSSEPIVAVDGHADGKNIISKNFDENGMLLYSDTIDLGDHVFNSCYYGMDEPGVILRLTPGGKTAELKADKSPAVYTKELLLSKIILTPVYEENAEANKKRR